MPLHQTTTQSERELRSAYLHGCRILQWMAERLPIDSQSCAMRGMSQAKWFEGYSLLVASQVINSRLELLVPLSNAITTVQSYFDAALIDIYTHAGESHGNPEIRSTSKPETSRKPNNYMIHKQSYVDMLFA